jgi:hypothetical protein
MSYLNGIYQANDITVTGEDSAYFTNLTCDNFQGVDGTFFTGVTSNIQDQIDDIVIGGLTNTRGYFSLITSAGAGFSTTPTYTWIWSGGATSSTASPISHNFPFIISSLFITFGTTVTSAGTIVLEKNGVTYQTFSGITAETRYTGLTLEYAATDKLNIRTTAGAGGGIARITLTCEYEVYGQAPIFSIGSVTTHGSTASVSQTGTDTAPVLNFNFIDPATSPAVIALDTKTQNLIGSSAYTQVNGVLNVVNPGPVSIQNNGISLDNFYANKGDTQADINSLNSYVSSLNGSVSGLNTTVAGLSSVVAGIGSSLASTDATVAGLVTSQAATDTALTALTTRVTTAEGEIDVIEDRVQNITATIGETTIAGSLTTGPLFLDVINAEALDLTLNAPGGAMTMTAGTVQIDATYTDVFGTLRATAIGSTTSLSIAGGTTASLNATTAVSVSGGTTASLTATTGVTVSGGTTASISAPSVTLSTPTGLGSISVGNFTDVVYVNGWPFLTYFGQW